MQPKVLHTLGGVSLLERVVTTAQQLNPSAIHVVYGHQGQYIREKCEHLAVNWVYQTEQLGTGHAVMQVMQQLKPDSQVLILSGDVPLISSQTLAKMQANHLPDGLSLLVANMSQPYGLGRIIRDIQNNIIAIVEEKDANNEQRLINEIYTGIMLLPAKLLQQWLPTLDSSNAQQEYYLTDIISLAVKQKVSVSSVLAANEYEVQGVNTRAQLIALERYYQHQVALQLLEQGVAVVDPNRFDLRGELQCGIDTWIDINTVFEGTVSLGNNVYIGPNCYIRNSVIADNVVIHPNSVIDNAVISEQCEIGPFARLRPGTKLAARVKVGNFVEIKKTTMGVGSKASHLSYLGDALVGDQVNIGAGTITCNYDGINKYQTIIEDGAFIGSDTQLVAPVKVGKNATIGAGSTIRRDAPAGQLTVSAARQKSVPGWKRSKD